MSKHFESDAVNLKTVAPSQIKAARAIAIAADLLQLAIFPLVFQGFLSPLNDVLDVVVCAILTKLVGWHYSFLPSFVVKVVPFADLVPTWTLAVFLATRQKHVPAQPPVTEVYAETVSPPQIKAPRSGGLD